MNEIGYAGSKIVYIGDREKERSYIFWRQRLKKNTMESSLDAEVGQRNTVQRNKA